MRLKSNLIKQASLFITASINPEIEVEVKNFYGRDNVYVVSVQKEAIQALTGSKTLTPGHIKALKELGFTFKSKAPNSI